MTDMPDTPDYEQSEGLTELAKRRREAAQQEATRPVPEFIQSVEQSEVLYTFEPSAIPFQQIDVLKLSEHLFSMFGVEIDGPDFSPLLGKLSREQLMAMPEAELMKKLVRAVEDRMPVLAWRFGRFPLRDDFVGIKQISLNYETIIVSVSGRSEVAEVVAKEVLELVWRLAGAKRTFSDLESHLQLTSYGTATRLNLGFGPEILLNPNLLTFMDAELAKGKGFAGDMGRVKRTGNRGPETANFQAIAALEDLGLEIRRFDLISGSTETAKVHFTVTGRSDFRSGRIRASTELPYDRHVELLSDLFDRLKA